MGSLGARVRWGILGTGRVAGEFSLGLKRLREAELAAVGSREPSRAAAFARAHGVARAHGSYDALVADPKVDVVYIATPNSHHRDHCLLALAAGKAVLCEKPFATNASEARDVVEQARERRLFCMEAMWTRFIPLVIRAEALVRQGEVGEPIAFHADFGLAVPRQDGRVYRPELGGGALLDLGVYLLAMARSFLGPALDVSGYAHMGPTGVDEQTSILLRHAGGRQSLLFASVRGETPTGATVLGTRGWLRLHPPLYRPHRLSIRHLPGRHDRSVTGSSTSPGVWKAWKTRLRPLYQRFGALSRPFRRRFEVDIVEPIQGNGYHHEAAEVMRCLRAEEIESPLMPLEETVAIAEMADRLRALWGGPPPGDREP